MRRSLRVALVVVMLLAAAMLVLWFLDGIGTEVLEPVFLADYRIEISEKEVRNIVLTTTDGEQIVYPLEDVRIRYLEEGCQFAQEYRSLFRHDLKVVYLYLYLH